MLLKRIRLTMASADRCDIILLSNFYKARYVCRDSFPFGMQSHQPRRSRGTVPGRVDMGKMPVKFSARDRAVRWMFSSELTFLRRVNFGTYAGANDCAEKGVPHASPRHVPVMSELKRRTHPGRRLTRKSIMTEHNESSESTRCDWWRRYCGS